MTNYFVGTDDTNHFYTFSKVSHRTNGYFNLKYTSYFLLNCRSFFEFYQNQEWIHDAIAILS